MSICSIVTGNSNSGSACIDELYKKYSNNLKVRGVFRSDAKAEALKKKYSELEIITGCDASKKETLRKAFDGAQSAMIVTVHDSSRGFEEDARLTRNLIDSAVECGVKYVVLVASFTVINCEKMPIISSRFKPVEDHLEKLGKEIGLKWTVLRGGFFMENLLIGWNQLKSGNDTFSYPKITVPMIDTADIGRCAAACLAAENKDDHNKKKYSMNGPELLSSKDVVNCFSKVLNREIKYNELTKEAYYKFMPLGVAQIMDYLNEMGKEAAPYTNDVRSLTGHSNSLEDFLKRHL